VLRCFLGFHATGTVVWAREHGDAGFEAEARAWLSELAENDVG
jgi:hypothetical protein